MPERKSRFPLGRLGLFMLSSLVSALALEVLLRLLLPITAFGVGSATAPKAAIYGWGFAPASEIEQTNQDTGEVFSSTANSAGWKDIEHQLAKPFGVKRILILGDSNTFGHAPLKDNYPRVLEDSWVRQACERRSSARDTAAGAPINSS